MLRMKNFLLAALALVVLGVGIAQAKTILSPSEVTNVLAHREWTSSVCNTVDAPSADTQLTAFIADRAFRLRRIELQVGNSLGSSGNTTMYLMQNGTTVASSSISVASNASGAPGAIALGYDRAVAAGDVLLLRIGAVTAGTNSRRIVGCLRLSEDF